VSVVEQIIRPTGLVDPVVEMKPIKGQVDDLLNESGLRTEKNESRPGDNADQAHVGGPGRVSGYGVGVKLRLSSIPKSARWIV